WRGSKRGLRMKRLLLPALLIAISVPISGCEPEESTSSPPVAGRPAPPSASRAPGEAFTEAARRSAPHLDTKADSGSSTPVGLRRLRAEPDAARVPSWSASDLAAVFAQVRDARVLRDDAHPDRPRRPTFLYPDDGCYARAEVMAREVAAPLAPPAKVFIFG